jgi:MinD superfamily P-loop ATPase
MLETAVISGKGGTGKSSVSAALASLHERVVLADCDVDAANLYLLFRPDEESSESFCGGTKAVIDPDRCTGCLRCVALCRFGAIEPDGKVVSISEVSCDGCRLCARLCPEGAIRMVQQCDSRLVSGTFRYGELVYGRLAPGEENSGKLVGLIRDRARSLASRQGIGHILLDGPPGIGCPVISTISGTGRVLVVTEPSLSGLHDLQRAIAVCRSFGPEIQVVINKHDLNPEGSRKIIGWCGDNGLRVTARLPFDPLVVRAMSAGRTITEYAPDAPVSKKIRNLYDRLF